MSEYTLVVRIPQAGNKEISCSINGKPASELEIGFLESLIIET